MIPQTPPGSNFTRNYTAEDRKFRSFLQSYFEDMLEKVEGETLQACRCPVNFEMRMMVRDPLYKQSVADYRDDHPPAIDIKCRHMLQCTGDKLDALQVKLANTLEEVVCIEYAKKALKELLDYFCVDLTNFHRRSVVAKIESWSTEKRSPKIRTLSEGLAMKHM